MTMKKKYLMGIALWLLALVLCAQDTTTVGKTMYQNQAFTAKDKQIFDADSEGSRVWRWSKAQNYCKRLSLSGYRDWRVASREELQALIGKRKSKRGLFVASAFTSTMPAIGGKYNNVWMWTRDSKSSKLGAFVNFKKATSGWADKKYMGYVICTRSMKKNGSTKRVVKCPGNHKQETTHSREWISAWDTCSGYTALKKDGSLWQFGKVGSCNWGQIIPIDPQTGKPEFKAKKVYHLTPKKIGNGFNGAKIINGGYRLYAIKKDGTLWGWGEGLGVKPLLLSKSDGWSNFGIRYAGNGCCGYDVGLKKDGTLWRFPESAFARDKYKTPLILKKISRFNDWKKIVLGCETIYGVRKNGSFWKSNDIDDKGVFKKYKPNKKTPVGDSELYPLLKSKMAKVPSGTVYNPEDYTKKIKVRKDGTLCLLPEIKYE